MAINGHAYGPLVLDVTRHGAATDGDATGWRGAAGRSISRMRPCCWSSCAQSLVRVSDVSVFPLLDVLLERGRACAIVVAVRCWLSTRRFVARGENKNKQERKRNTSRTAMRRTARRPNPTDQRRLGELTRAVTRSDDTARWTRTRDAQGKRQSSCSSTRLHGDRVRQACRRRGPLPCTAPTAVASAVQPPLAQPLTHPHSIYSRHSHTALAACLTDDTQTHLRRPAHRPHRRRSSASVPFPSVLPLAVRFCIAFFLRQGAQRRTLGG